MSLLTIRDAATGAETYRTDDAAKINVSGAVAVIDLAERVVLSIANRPARLTFTKVSTPSRMAGGPGNGAYFGSIPDMASGEENGMRLSGVSGPMSSASMRSANWSRWRPT